MFSGLWTKIKKDVVNAVALFGTVLSSIMSHIDSIAAALGDPNLTQQISVIVGDAKLFGRWMLFVSIVAIVARFKQLVETPKN